MSDPLAPAACWHCGEDTVIRLPGDWQDRINHGAALPLVGCGNPWHYATAGLDTSALAAPPPEADDHAKRWEEEARLQYENVQYWRERAERAEAAPPPEAGLREALVKEIARALTLLGIEGNQPNASYASYIADYLITAAALPVSPADPEEARNE